MDKDGCVHYPAKKYGFIGLNRGTSYSYYVCENCLQILERRKKWNISLKESCNCGLILCKDCMKNVKEVMEF